jgi:hypothetical protein
VWGGNLLFMHCGHLFHVADPGLLHRGVQIGKTLRGAIVGLVANAP